ncbi:response regulator [Desulfobacterota bacterium M19]
MSGESLNILLVEDNEDHAELIQRSFRENQIANKIYWVKDGEEALDYLFQRGVYADSADCLFPHLILLDLRLPKIDGIEVLKTIKTDERLKSIPVVVLTSSESEKDIRKVYQYYANSYLVKPIDFQQFTRLMRDLGFYWLGWNKNPFGVSELPGS